MSDQHNEAAQRRLSLKRVNERVKLAATFFNGIGIASIVVAMISPIMNGTVISLSHGIISGVVALAFHGLAQRVLQGLRSEEI